VFVPIPYSTWLYALPFVVVLLVVVFYRGPSKESPGGRRARMLLEIACGMGLVLWELASLPSAGAAASRYSSDESCRSSVASPVSAGACSVASAEITSVTYLPGSFIRGTLGRFRVSFRLTDGRSGNAIVADVGALEHHLPAVANVRIFEGKYVEIDSEYGRMPTRDLPDTALLRKEDWLLLGAGVALLGFAEMFLRPLLQPR
jgi:hypothetical protein